MSNCVAVDIHSLIIGRELSLPIHDVNGVLLVAAGKCFTREIKLKIIERGINKVLIDEADAENATLKGDDAEAATSESLSEQVSEKLESLVRSGVTNVRNVGPALCNEVVKHGKKKYDQKQTATLGEKHAESSGAIDDLMQKASETGEVDASQVTDVTESYISSLTGDIENTLSVGFMKNQDPSLAQHSLNVAVLGMAIGIEMGFDRENIRMIGIAGLVQDIGMAFVPKELREAARPLTEVEFVEIQKHPIRAANILEKAREIPDLVTLIAYQSHERPDGTGYPRGRHKKSIHPFARVLQVADAYTAMTSARPHRAPLMAYAAMETLLRQARNWHVDPLVVRNLLHVLSLFPIGSFAVLSDGSVAKVLRSSGEEFTRPIVMLVQDREGNRLDNSQDAHVIDLCDSELTIVQALPTPGRNEIRLSAAPKAAAAAV